MHRLARIYLPFPLQLGTVPNIRSKQPLRRFRLFAVEERTVLLCVTSNFMVVQGRVRSFDRITYHKGYERYEKKSSSSSTHDPAGSAVCKSEQDQPVGSQ